MSEMENFIKQVCDEAIICGRNFSIGEQPVVTPFLDLFKKVGNTLAERGETSAILYLNLLLTLSALGEGNGIESTVLLNREGH